MRHFSASKTRLAPVRAGLSVHLKLKLNIGYGQTRIDFDEKRAEAREVRASNLAIRAACREEEDAVVTVVARAIRRRRGTVEITPLSVRRPVSSSAEEIVTYGGLVEQSRRIVLETERKPP